MPVAVRTSAPGIQSGYGTGTNITVTKPTGVVEGDLLVAVTGTDNEGTLAGLTAPAGWTQIGQQTLASCGNVKVWQKIATASEPTSYAFPKGLSNTDGVGGMVAFTGQHATTPLAVAPQFTATATASTSHTAPSVAGVADGALATFHFAGGTGNADRSYTPPSGMTEQFEGGGLGYVEVAGNTQLLTTTAATGPKTAVCSQATASITVALVVAPAAPAVVDHTSTPSDVAAAADAVTTTAGTARTGADTAAAADTAVAAKASTATAADTAGAVDTVVPVFTVGGVNPADNAAATDTADRVGGFTRPASDTALGSDTVTRIGAFIRSAGDLTEGEPATPGFAVAPFATSSFGGSAEPAAQTGARYDAAAATDTVSATRVLSAPPLVDTAGASDTVSISKVGNGTASFTSLALAVDTVTVTGTAARTAASTATATDTATVTRGLTRADTAAATDTVTVRQGQAVTFTDSAAATDHVFRPSIGHLPGHATLLSDGIGEATLEPVNEGAATLFEPAVGTAELIGGEPGTAQLDVGVTAATVSVG